MPATPVPTAKLLEEDIAHGEAELRKYQRLVPFWRNRLKQLQGGRPRNYVMYDSIDLAAIPETALAVAGYVDGHWLWAARAERARLDRRIRAAVAAMPANERPDSIRRDTSPAPLGRRRGARRWR